MPPPRPRSDRAAEQPLLPHPILGFPATRRWGGVSRRRRANLRRPLAAAPQRPLRLKERTSWAHVVRLIVGGTGDGGESAHADPFVPTNGPPGLVAPSWRPKATASKRSLPDLRTRRRGPVGIPDSSLAHVRKRRWLVPQASMVCGMTARRAVLEQVRPLRPPPLGRRAAADDLAQILRKVGMRPPQSVGGRSCAARWRLLGAEV
jgi:hypothetical protein